MVPAASGWRAMASIAAATDLPSASAGPIEPIETAITAPMMLTSLASTKPPSCRFGTADCGTNENGCKHREDVGLNEADQDFQHHERDWNEQAGEGHNHRNHELPAHHVAEQAHHQGECTRYLGHDVEWQHD